MNAMQALVQGLVYPAFLACFLGNFTSDIFSESIGLFDSFRAIVFFVIFGILFLETTRCPHDQYRLGVFCLDVFEIIIMTLNFISIGLSSEPEIPEFLESISQPEFGLTYYFGLNALVVALACY